MNMRQRFTLFPAIWVFLVSVFLAGCTSPVDSKFATQGTSELIESLRHKRIEKLYYNENEFPENVSSLMRRPDMLSNLINAYHLGGDDLFRFNIVVILNHRDIGLERKQIVRFLGDAVNDTSPWVRTEAVWGIGNKEARYMLPIIIPLLDDPSPDVVNETILAFERIIGVENLPISNRDISDKEREQAVMLIKDWAKKHNIQPPPKRLPSNEEGEPQTIN